MYKIGIDLGGTNIALGIIKDDRIVFKRSIPTGLPKAPEKLVGDIKDFAENSVSEFGLTINDMEKIGLGIPGSINKKNAYLEFANNFGYVHVPLIKMLREALEVPVFAGNDANVAALAEYSLGAAKGADSMAMFTLGTGLGGAYIADGKILSGVNGAAGEFGHEVIVVDGAVCSCGRSGCSEMYVSASALRDAGKAAAKANPQSILYKKTVSTSRFGAKEVIDAANEGDVTAGEVYRKYLKYLSTAMANIINIFQPEVFVIGGGMSYAGDALLTPLKEMVTDQVYSRTMDINTDIRLAMLGNDAGILGAGLLEE